MRESSPVRFGKGRRKDPSHGHLACGPLNSLAPEGEVPSGYPTSCHPTDDRSRVHATQAGTANHSSAAVMIGSP